MSNNDITGDRIATKIGTKTAKQLYDENYDKIFRKNKFSEESQSEAIELLKKNLENASTEKELSGLTFFIDEATSLKIKDWLKTEVYPEVVKAQRADPKCHTEYIISDEDGTEYPYEGAIGGGLSYIFTPTSLGIIISVKYSGIGKVYEKDFTEWDSF